MGPDTEKFFLGMKRDWRDYIDKGINCLQVLLVQFPRFTHKLNEIRQGRMHRLEIEEWMVAMQALVRIAFTV